MKYIDANDDILINKLILGINNFLQYNACSPESDYLLEIYATVFKDMSFLNRKNIYDILYINEMPTSHIDYNIDEIVSRIGKFDKCVAFCTYTIEKKCKIYIVTLTNTMYYKYRPLNFVKNINSPSEIILSVDYDLKKPNDYINTKLQINFSKIDSDVKKVETSKIIEITGLFKIYK
jgi:hypothetical protein